MLDAAFGHDLLEDTHITEDEIIAVSNERVLSLIKELTNTEDDTHTEQYMQQLRTASEEARLIKYADLIENTASVCFSLHVVSPNWEHNVFHPIICGTIQALEATSFPTYPQTVDYMRSVLEMFVNLLNDKRFMYDYENPVK